MRRMGAYMGHHRRRRCYFLPQRKRKSTSLLDVSERERVESAAITNLKSSCRCWSARRDCVRRDPWAWNCAMGNTWASRQTSWGKTHRPPWEWLESLACNRANPTLRLGRQSPWGWCWASCSRTAEAAAAAIQSLNWMASSSAAALAASPCCCGFVWALTTTDGRRPHRGCLDQTTGDPVIINKQKQKRHEISIFSN